jgi:hypothetical protein
MSNSSLAEHIHIALQLVRSGESNAKSLAQALRENGHAMEGMPYVLISECDTIALKLDIASELDENGFIPDLEPLLSRTDSWLQKIPQNM